MTEPLTLERIDEMEARCAAKHLPGARMTWDTDELSALLALARRALEPPPVAAQVAEVTREDYAAAYGCLELSIQDTRAASAVAQLIASTRISAYQAGLRAGAELRDAYQAFVDLYVEIGGVHCEFHGGQEDEYAHECENCDSVDRLVAALHGVREKLGLLAKEAK